MIKAGTKFWNEGKTEGYEFNRDVVWGQVRRLDDLTAFGEAPRPDPAKMLPEWFLRDIHEAFKVKVEA